jgi:hypothetical protein
MSCRKSSKRWIAKQMSDLAFEPANKLSTQMTSEPDAITGHRGDSREAGADNSDVHRLVC